MQGVPTTDTATGCDGCVNTPTSFHLYQQLRRLARACPYASHTICVVMGTLTPCLENSSIIPCGCLMFIQFCHLVYPFAPAYFHKRSTLLRVHPPLWLVSRRRITSYGCSAWWFCLYAFRTFWRTYERLYLLSIFNQYRFSSSATSSGLRPPSPNGEGKWNKVFYVPVCKSRRLYPGCS